MTRAIVHFFLAILSISLFCSLLGGLFAWVIAMISPDFIIHMFYLGKDYQAVSQYAFSTGMVLGLVIGASVAGFSCLLVILNKMIGLITEWIQSGAQLTNRGCNPDDKKGHQNRDVPVMEDQA